MQEISARTSFPYRTVVYISVIFPNGETVRGSGAVIGNNDVLTAMHVVYDATRGGWGTKFAVTPGADTSPLDSPYGVFRDVAQLSAPTQNWDTNGDGQLSNAEAQYDIALISLSSNIQSVVGSFGLMPNKFDFYGTMAGYPSRGTGLMAERVYADALDTSTVYRIGSELGQGASGGPLFTDEGRVAGVLSAGDNSSSIYAGLWNNSVWNWLIKAMSDNDSLITTTPAPSPGGGGRGSDNPIVGVFVQGTAVSDSLTGNAAGDLLQGLGGNDILNGGDGKDTASYRGSRSEYSLRYLNGDGSVTIIDNVANRDGTDQLVSIERLKFAEGFYAIDTQGSGGMAYRLYKAAFNRTPDAAGLGYQINVLDMGAALSSVANNFLASPEFQQTYGALNSTQFVTQLYLNVLGRAADSTGLNYHVGNLSVGMGRNDVLAAFSESPENQAAVIGVILNGVPYTI